MGGPPIAPGERVNVYSGQQDRRFLGVVVRVDDSLARVRFSREPGMTR
jgi:hypothetical protein